MPFRRSGSEATDNINDIILGHPRMLALTDGISVPIGRQSLPETNERPGKFFTTHVSGTCKRN